MHLTHLLADRHADTDISQPIIQTKFSYEGLLNNEKWACWEIVLFKRSPLFKLSCYSLFWSWLNTSTPSNCAHRAETNKQAGYYLKIAWRCRPAEGHEHQLYLSLHMEMLCGRGPHRSLDMQKRSQKAPLLCGTFVRRFTEMQEKVWWSINKIQHSTFQPIRK